MGNYFSGWKILWIEYLRLIQWHENEKKNLDASTDQLLDIDHVNLQFPFESGKQIYSSLYLVTMTDNYVAFTVKTTTPKTCCVRPSIGVVPRSSSELLVTMQVQKEAPADMQCKNNFLLQCVVALIEFTATVLLSSRRSRRHRSRRNQSPDEAARASGSFVMRLCVTHAPPEIVAADFAAGPSPDHRQTVARLSPGRHFAAAGMPPNRCDS
ncbi:unnamed protein product [Brassica rapa]|uniref:MSP domain-containing protein n=1 Tax=Brassica campestris TaxID=3711 RepID=A0A8D9CUQ5_BRACM|nr:unnamed protein product [Brassica rapa]